MNESLAYGVPSPAARDRTHTLFAQTMGYVAVTAGFFALGSYLGRDLSEGWAFVWFIVAFACLIGMNFAVRRSGGLSVVLLLVFGTAMGLAMAPLLAYYADHRPAGAVAGRRGHRAVHRRVRRGRLCDSA